MKKQVEMTPALRNQLVEDTIGMVELDQAVLGQVSGGCGGIKCPTTCT